MNELEQLIKEYAGEILYPSRSGTFPGMDGVDNCVLGEAPLFRAFIDLRSNSVRIFLEVYEALICLKYSVRLAGQDLKNDLSETIFLAIIEFANEIPESNHIELYSVESLRELLTFIVQEINQL
jgi:hypothetical protein